MRTFFMALVALSVLAAPRLVYGQPRPSDATPEDQFGPTFDLPAPGSGAARRSPPTVIPAPPPSLATPSLTTPSLMAPPTGATPMPPSTFVPETTYLPEATVPYGEAPQAGASPQYGSAAPPGQLDNPPQISPNAERWRYMNYGGRWWYLQPSNHWSYWSEGRWVEYSASRYSNTAGLTPPPLPRRRVAVGLGFRPAPYVAPGPGYPYGAYPYGAYRYGSGSGYYGPSVGVGVGVY